MKQKRTCLPLQTRCRLVLQQVKSAGAVNRHNSSKFKKRPRVLPYSLDQAFFSCRLEDFRRSHRKNVAHLPAPLPKSDLVPTSRCRLKKEKRLTLPTVSRITPEWLLVDCLAL